MNSCKPSAVDDSAKPSAATTAVCHRAPSHQPTAKISAAVTSTWLPPTPRIGRRSAHNLRGSSSKPMRNNSSTTPISEKCRMSPTLLIKPSPHGPMQMPAAR